MKKPKLYIAYFWNDNKKDCDVFVADEDRTVSLESEFKKYANKSWGKKIKDDDIEGIYPCEETEDCEMNVYKIKVVAGKGKVISKK